MEEKKRVRSTQVGFVGVNFAKGGDMTLYKRLQKAVKADPEMDQSKFIREAVKDKLDQLGVK